MESKGSRKAPILRVLTPEGTARTLREHLRKHNVRVAIIAVCTFLAAALLWTLLYAVVCWLILLAGSAGGNADVAIPPYFLAWFIVLGAASVAWVWFSHRLRPGVTVSDKKLKWEIALDFFFAIPRVTYAFFRTVSAWRTLTPEEYLQAAQFLHRLSAKGRLPLPSVPQDIPDDRSRERVLLTLQLMEIVDLKKKDLDWFVTLHVSRPKAFQFNRADDNARTDIW